MLVGFEEQTQELSEQEYELAKKVTRAFLARGKDSPITSTMICLKMRENGYKINDVRLRKIIEFIRHKQWIKWLIASGTKGYEWTTDLKKVERYTESLKQRESAIRTTRLSFPNNV